MEKIIPGYFIPIWQDIMMNRRDYAIKLISELTLIPLNVLRKAVFCNDALESKTCNRKVSDICIYMDYKYCVVEISKEYYKRLACGDKDCLNDMDLSKRFIKKLKICISFEDEDFLIKSAFVTDAMTDYGFLHIGIKPIISLKNRDELNEMERMLLCLVIDNKEEIKKYDDYDLSSIILKYQDNYLFKEWFRTYQDYLNCSNLLNIVSKSEDSSYISTCD